MEIPVSEWGSPQRPQVRRRPLMILQPDGAPTKQPALPSAPPWPPRPPVIDPGKPPGHMNFAPSR